MKTNILSQSGIQAKIRHGAICMAMSGLLITSASAAGANGVYEVESAKGTIRFAGRSITIPKALIKRIARVTDNSITIENNSISLNKDGALRLIRRFGNATGLEFNASVSGPSSVTLVQQGDSLFQGSTSSPVVVSFETTEFIRFSGTLRVNVIAEVRNETLTLDMPLGGRFLGRRIGGSMTIVCSR